MNLNQSTSPQYVMEKPISQVIQKAANRLDRHLKWNRQIAAWVLDVPYDESVAVGDKSLYFSHVVQGKVAESLYNFSWL